MRLEHAEKAYDVGHFPAWRRPWWHLLHALCYVYFWPMYRFRSWGARHIPAQGPVLVVSNHQSYFDPIILGLPLWRRPFWALARKTLFRNRVFGWLIRSLNAIPVDQSGSDMKSMRACMEVLKAGRVLIVYPEGARTLDGTTGPFAEGTMLLIKRTRPLVVPAAIEGAYQAYPRGAKRPKATGRIAVQFGEPMPAEQLLAMDAKEAMATLRQQVETLRLDLVQRMGHGGADAGR